LCGSAQVREQSRSLGRSIATAMPGSAKTDSGGFEKEKLPGVSD
jgi:hypothetical protein